MIKLTLSQVADIVGGELIDPYDADRDVTGVIIDSRLAQDGSLFVALPGEHVDGHRFIADACARGAAGYLMAAGHPPDPSCGAIVVDDPADALLGLGAWVRTTVNPTVVGVTGSNGKTTTKDLAAAAIGAGRRVIANEGSYNNELGVPLTCCRLEADTQVLVAEIGARGTGHIADLASLIEPDIGVVTTVSGAHLELFGDIAAVALAKAEMIAALPPDGVAVLNADDPYVSAMANDAECPVRTFGLDPKADWRAESVTFDRDGRATFTVVTPSGQAQVVVPLPGAHHVTNALAALAVAEACGVALPAAAAAIATAPVSRWRMEVTRPPGGLTLINDAYNANPASMAAALHTLATMVVKGRRWAVLGVMGELGSATTAGYAQVGTLVTQLNIDELIVVGQAARPLAAGAGFGTVVDDVEAAIALVRAQAAAGDAILIKASRAAGLERIAAALSGGDR